MRIASPSVPACLPEVLHCCRRIGERGCSGPPFRRAYGASDIIRGWNFRSDAVSKLSVMGRWIAGFMVLLHATRGIVIAADRVIEDQTTATMIFRKVAVPASIISQQYALERARQFLLDNSGAKMIRLTMVPDAEPATYSLMGCDHCDPYRFWRMQWEPVSEVPFSIAELMSIERNAVLRYRDTKGAVSVTVIQGNDPRPISIGNYQGRMIQLEWRAGSIGHSQSYR
jgi:hypothetical protein